jgi:ABC-2 type transport system ATP-binding protein
MNAIEVDNLTKKFSPPRGLRKLVAKSSLEQEIVAVDHVSFTARRGEILAFVGSNGAGKTTLIKMLCTLLWPTSGKAKICGFDLVRDEDKVRALIGYVSGEERSFFWRLTGRENLEFFASLHGMKGRDVCKKAVEVLKVVELTEAAGNMFYSYSSGMKQRLAIARALLAEPRILFLDELTKSLDPAAYHSLLDFIRRMAKEIKVTVIMASHKLDEVEKFCDRVLVMHQGENKFMGTVEQFETTIGESKRYALELSGIPNEVLRLHLLSYSDLTDVSIDGQDQDGLIKVEFTSLNGGSILSRVLKNVLSTGAEVHSCCKKEVHLEELFVQHFQGGSN